MATDGSGHITQWNLFLQGAVIVLPNTTTTRNTIQTINEANVVDTGHFYDPAMGANYVAFGTIGATPGIWTSDVPAVAPEPATAGLLLIGSFALAASRRWRSLPR